MIPLKEQLGVLSQIQELDLKIDKISREKGALPGSLKVVQDRLAKLDQAIAAKNIEQTELDKTLRQTQAGIELNRDRLVRAKSKLESVQNSQEFQAVNKEIDQLGKMTVTLEEQVKKIKSDIDQCSLVVQKLEAEAAGVRQEKEGHESQLTTTSGNLEGEIQKILQDRNQFAHQVGKPILLQYDRVRKARAGVGLAPALAGRCGVCNVMLPPQLYNEIHKYQHHQNCPSCHRILFIPGTVGGENSSKGV